MTNKIAIALLLMIAAFFAANAYYGWNADIFLMKKFVDLIAFATFWR